MDRKTYSGPSAKDARKGGSISFGFALQEAQIDAVDMSSSII